MKKITGNFLVAVLPHSCPCQQAQTASPEAQKSTPPSLGRDRRKTIYLRCLMAVRMQNLTHMEVNVCMVGLPRSLDFTSVDSNN